jgi:hypothetical protein
MFFSMIYIVGYSSMLTHVVLLFFVLFCLLILFYYLSVLLFPFMSFYLQYVLLFPLCPLCSLCPFLFYSYLDEQLVKSGSCMLMQKRYYHSLKQALFLLYGNARLFASLSLQSRADLWAGICQCKIVSKIVNTIVNTIVHVLSIVDSR